MGNSIKIVGLHRKYKGTLPTSLILLKTETAAAQQYLLNNDLEINEHTLKTRLYILNYNVQTVTNWDIQNTLAKMNTNA